MNIILTNQVFVGVPDNSEVSSSCLYRAACVKELLLVSSVYHRTLEFSHHGDIVVHQVHIAVSLSLSSVSDSLVFMSDMANSNILCCIVPGSVSLEVGRARPRMGLPSVSRSITTMTTF